MATNDERRLRVAVATNIVAIALVMLYVAYQARRTANAIERMEARQLKQERKQMQALEQSVEGESK